MHFSFSSVFSLDICSGQGNSLWIRAISLRHHHGSLRRHGFVRGSRIPVAPIVKDIKPSHVVLPTKVNRSHCLREQRTDQIILALSLATMVLILVVKPSWLGYFIDPPSPPLGKAALHWRQWTPELDSTVGTPANPVVG